MTDEQFAAGLRLPARGAQERAPLLDRQHRDRAGDGRRRGRSRLGLERRRRAVARPRVRRSRSSATPTEGLSTWVCGYVRLKDAPGSADKAYDFLNADQRAAKSRASCVDDWGYGHANAKGMAAVDPAVLEEKGYADVDKFVDKTLFQSPVPAELQAEDDRRVREDQGRLLSDAPSAADVIVVGAGFCRPFGRARADATPASTFVVLEARDRVGGRVESRVNGLGERVDTGGQFLCDDMPEVMALARRRGKTLVEHACRRRLRRAAAACRRGCRARLCRLDGDPRAA